MNLDKDAVLSLLDMAFNRALDIYKTNDSTEFNAGLLEGLREANILIQDFSFDLMDLNISSSDEYQ